MRKHFLILMLMALLPLSGWADSFNIGGSDFTFAIASSTYDYTGAPVEVGAELRKEDILAPIAAENYKLLYFEDGSNESSETAPTEVGTYQVQAQGIEAKGYTGTTQKITFLITKGTIVAGNITTTPAKVDGLVYSGGEQTLITAGTVAASYGTLQYALGDGAYSTALPKATNAGTYTVKWKVVGSNNYNDYTEGADIEVTIGKKAVESPLTILVEGVPTEAVTYNASEQKISGITVKVKNGDNVLVTYDAPVVEYYAAAERTGDQVASVTNATTYYLKIKEPATGTVNYSFADVTKTYMIAQKALTLSIAANDKVYDGAAFTTAEAQLAPSPLAEGDVIAEGTTYTVIPTFAAGVNDYSISVNNVTIKHGETDVTANYNIVKPAKTWSITKAPLTINIKSLSIASGTAPNNTSVTAQFAIESVTGAVESEKTTITGDVTIAYDSEKITTEQQASTTLAAQTFTGAIKGTQGSNAVWDNYEPTINAGNLTILGKGFTIIPSIASVQYGTAITPDYTAYNEDLSAAEVDKATLKYEYKLQSAAVWSESLPTAVGTYDVRFKDGTVVGSGANLQGEATIQQSTFSINKKVLTVTVADQNAFKGDNVALFLANLKAADDSYEVTGLVGEETIDVEFSLDEEVIKVAEGKIDGYQAGKSKADASIKIALTAEGTYNGNYDITGFTAGKLDISETLVATLTNDGTAASVIATGVANGNAYNVTISGRTLKANQWNAIVLPFAVKPLDFCNAIGQYAVFNTLSKVEKDASDVLKDKIYFKLELNEIAANEPFLVKPLAAVEADFTINNVEFKGTGADPVYTGVAGATFTGTYKATADIASTNWWALSGGKFLHFSAARTNGLKFTNAYIELTSGASAAEFFVEDIDNNGVTAIKSLNLDTMETVDMNGWYTVGGVKLQGAPVEKGVYINNGKKVVIK